MRSIKRSRRAVKRLTLLIAAALALLLLLRLWLYHERNVLEDVRSFSAEEEAYNDTLKSALDEAASGS